MDKEYTLCIMTHFKAKKREKCQREVCQFILKMYKATKETLNYSHSSAKETLFL